MPDESTIERYRDAALQLLPPGRALSKEPDSNVGKLLESLSVEFARVDETAASLRSNFVPSTAVEMLDDWEEALGLPGSCVSSPSTVVTDRQGALAAKVRGRASHSETAYEQAGEDLGYDTLEFVRFAPFRAGASAGSACYGDNWANHVQVLVDTSDQTADEELACIFDHDLRRAHGSLDIVMEGPMGAVRNHYPNYISSNTLGASILAASITDVVELRYGGFLSTQSIIDNGSGAAPADNPQGTWKLYSSVDGVTFTEITSAAVTSEIALINPNGNNVVSAWSVFTNVPGRYIKVAYARTSGGGTTTRATLHLSTW